MPYLQILFPNKFIELLKLESSLFRQNNLNLSQIDKQNKNLTELNPLVKSCLIIEFFQLKYIYRVKNCFEFYRRTDC